MSELGATHPEMVRRWGKLVELCWRQGAEVWIGSSTRSYATQADLYARWKRGAYLVPSVANPDNDGGPSAFGWDWSGSYHMVQADGCSHALDLGYRGIARTDFEFIALVCGLRRTVRNESWHFQWTHRTTVFAAPALAPLEEEDDDMATHIVTAAPGPSERYPNGHPCAGHLFLAFGNGFLTHLRTNEQVELHRFLGAQTAPDGSAKQLPHDWFDESLIVRGPAVFNPVSAY